MAREGFKMRCNGEWLSSNCGVGVRGSFLEEAETGMGSGPCGQHIPVDGAAAAEALGENRKTREETNSEGGVKGRQGQIGRQQKAE